MDNYALNYKNRTFTATQFLRLKKITPQDKFWVAQRLMNPNKLRLALADIAESVLHIFERRYPNDPRPRNAIAAARNQTLTKEQNRIADAADAAAADAADAADAAACAADAAACAAYAAADAAARRDQWNLNLKILNKYWK